MRGKVNLIYMDPPYNKSFRSNFQADAEFPEAEEDWDDLPNDPLAIKAFRDTYRDGVHSYLDGLYEQLTLGRELLADDGSFIIQIGPDNLHEVVLLAAEVFGRENHVATIPYRTTTNPSTRLLPEIGNWLVWFAKSKGACPINPLPGGLVKQ
jgi:adenine-specific DNA-methyltransferase